MTEKTSKTQTIECRKSELREILDRMFPNATEAQDRAMVRLFVSVFDREGTFYAYSRTLGLRVIATEDAKAEATAELVDFGTLTEGVVNGRRYAGFKLADGTFVVDNKGYAPGQWTEVQPVTKEDLIVKGCTIRTWYKGGEFFRADVFNPSGWKVGSYKTAAGALRAAKREGSK